MESRYGVPLIRVIDAPGSVTVTVRPGVPLPVARRFRHDGVAPYSRASHDTLSVLHRSALRDAAAYAAEAADKYHCRWKTNY